MNSNNCLTTEIKRAFLADELSNERREIAETHLSECGACRRQMAMMLSEIKTEEALPLPESLKEKAKRIPAQQITEKPDFFTAIFAYFKQPVAVAASIVLLLAFASIAYLALKEKVPTHNSQEEKFRQGNTTSIKPELLSPATDSAINTGEMEFRWSKVINALSYTLIILDEKGDIIAQQTTKNENFSLNVSALNSTNNKHFFWFVRVKLADGTTANSDTAKLLFTK